jgi:hypothetical protein
VDPVRRLDRYLSSLTGASEVLVLFGPDFPGSVYKAYVRRAPGCRWWRFDVGHPCPLNGQYQNPDPRKVRRRVPAAVVRVHDLPKYYYHPGRSSLRALWSRAGEL